MFNPKHATAALCAIGVTFAVAAGYASAAALPQGSEPVNLDPAEFTTQIDNPYFPLVPGDRYVYHEVDGRTKERTVLGVTNQTKRIANGVTARVIHDRVTSKGKVIEDTLDWYAQDSSGNVWYLGEDTVECSGKGKVKTSAGSFEAGVDGAQPGVIMPADPQPGQAYRQEYYAGQAEDRAVVLSADEQVQVKFGRFTNAVLTKELVPVEPKVQEYKVYAPGVGTVLTLKTSGGKGREQLLKVRHGRQVEPPKPSRRCVV